MDLYYKAFHRGNISVPVFEEHDSINAGIGKHLFKQRLWKPLWDMLLKAVMTRQHGWVFCDRLLSAAPFCAAMTWWAESAGTFLSTYAALLSSHPAHLGIPSFALHVSCHKATATVPSFTCKSSRKPGDVPLFPHRFKLSLESLHTVLGLSCMLIIDSLPSSDSRHQKMLANMSFYLSKILI